MKKFIVYAAMAAIAIPVQAQDNINLDTYIGAQLTTEDLLNRGRNDKD